MTKIVIALAGNANVGKSVLFNQLTGLHQHIGNWPGKTVERAEGTLHFEGHIIDVIDLPGIYSLSTFSTEELITRDYIAVEKPDAVINVVDASVLERNMFFTIQLLELETPMIMALNQVDLAKKKGIIVNHEKLEELLGIPVIPTIAIKGVGVHELLEKAIEVTKKARTRPAKIKYGREIEERIERIAALVRKLKIGYPARYVAIKLLEGDREIKEIVGEISSKTVSVAEKCAKEIERIHGHACSTVIASERYNIANRVASKSQQLVVPETGLLEKLDEITVHKIWGYPIAVTVTFAMFFTIFSFGNFFSDILNVALRGVKPLVETVFGVGMSGTLIWGAIEGVIAGITIALPYIVPFYIILGVLEDSGYLPRIAFLMDNLMHEIGLHGKAFIPLILGYGCNVPACFGCRIMETHRERLMATFVTTLVPCAARTVIILGLAGKFLGIGWALALYGIDLLIIFVLGRIAFKVLPGGPTGLIMEMSSYRVPHLNTVAKQVWFRLEEFVYIAFPLMIAGSFAIKVLEVANLLEPIGKAMSPVTMTWLGLPAITGVVLIFGILRKELTLIMLAALTGTSNFAMILTKTQMIVFTLVTMFYIPCIATIVALVKELGWKNALYITLFEILFAVFLGGIAFRLLLLV